MGNQEKKYISIGTFENPQWAGDGWELIQVTHRQRVEYFDSYDSCGRSERRYSSPINEPVFVMGKTKDTVLDEYRARQEELSSIINKLKHENKELNEKSSDFERSSKSYEASTKKYNELYFAEIKNKDEWANKAHRMEQDIAKIRSAIGEIRMNEILGGK